jgi:glucosamine-6-phosphate deaminase
MTTRTFDQMAVRIFDSPEELGRTAAQELREILAQAIAVRGEAAIVLATGNSQLAFFRALREMHDIAWDRITVLHMDEYLGMDEWHPASFRRFLREQVVDRVRPRVFHGIAGDAADPRAEAERYAALLAAHEPVATVMGIGENGHIAFNDPPADFTTTRLVHIVELDEACRRQQVGEGHFASLDDVPRRALSLTVPALLRPPHVLAIVPERRKAAAVRAALEGPVSPVCPASILRTQPHVRLYLDRDSASLLS